MLLTTRLRTGFIKATKHTPAHLIRSYATKPPTYFSQYAEPPTHTPRSLFSEHTETEPRYQQDPQPRSQHTTSRLSSIRDLSVVISILALTYFAVDNYKTRVALEQRLVEQGVAHMKSLAVTQNNFKAQAKKRELVVLNERRAAQKREMKLVFHVAMLRKQLAEAGLKPVEIEEAVKEFEKNVKMETSVSNVSGTALWVIDESPMKTYVPNPRDYDTPKK